MTARATSAPSTATTGRALARASAACGVTFLLLAVLVSTGWSTLVRFDDRWSARAYGFTVNHRWCQVLAEAATWMGATSTLTVLTSVVVLGCLLTHRLPLGLWLAVTVAGSALLNSLVKLGMERIRPPSAGVLISAHGFAFPSGHTQGATSTYTAVVLVVGWQVWRPRRRGRQVTAVAVTLLVGAVGLSRLLLGVHWPTDVLGGWLLGSTCVLAATAAFPACRESVS